MNVMMHFIYGGTLDFPDKANVGYVLLLIILNVKVLIFLASVLLSYVSKCHFETNFEIKALLLFLLLSYLVCVWEYLKIISYCI